MAKTDIIIVIAALLMTGMSVLVMFPLWKPTTPVWWMVKALPTTFSPVMLVIAALILLYGLRTSSILIAVPGVWLVLFFAVHIARVTMPPPKESGFEQAFGHRWKQSDPAQKSPFALKTRFGFGSPDDPRPVLTQDIPYYTIASTDRKLLCDVWEPAPNIRRSGLVVVYLHGSAWYLWDKDAGTRRFFRHLTAQGHVVMDVAYRLYPETNMKGMVHDAKHAVSWIQDRAVTYGVDPGRIILCGGSAGAHIALLTAYTESVADFTPEDVMHRNLHVMGVISMYGPTDLIDLYFHTGQNIAYEHLQREPKPPGEMPRWVQNLIGESNYRRLGLYKNPNTAFLPDILGGTPDEIAETYETYSPLSHIHAACPPTLLVQGTHDLITSAKSTRLFYARLKEAGVPVVMHLLPQIDHGYDLFLPGISPSTHNSWFDVDQFLEIVNSGAASGVHADLAQPAAEMANETRLTFRMPRSEMNKM